MAKRCFFIAGTDTDAGKTLASIALLEAANKKGWSTIGLKPIAAGCEETEDGLKNADALALQQAASHKLVYDVVNPVALKEAIAPHIAAQHEKRMLSADRIAALCRGALMHSVDFALVEGAGGWRVPLNPRETMAQIPKVLNTPVILVVGMKLGCISHALLTAEAIVKDGLTIAGWVANRIDPNMACYDENLATLKQMFRAPLIAEIPFLDTPTAEAAAQFVDLDLLA